VQLSFKTPQKKPRAIDDDVVFLPGAKGDGLPPLEFPFIKIRRLDNDNIGGNHHLCFAHILVEKSRWLEFVENYQGHWSIVNGFF